MTLARVGHDVVPQHTGGVGSGTDQCARSTRVEAVKVIWGDDPGGTKIITGRHPSYRVESVVPGEMLFDDGKLSEIVGLGLRRIREVAMSRGMNAIIAPELIFDADSEPGAFTVFIQACPCWVQVAPSA